MPSHKPIRTYEKKPRNNISTSENNFNVLLAENLAKRSKSIRKKTRLKLKKLPPRVAEYLTDESLKVSPNNTFDKLLKGKVYNSVKIASFVKNCSSENEPSKSNLVHVRVSIHSPTMTRQRSRIKALLAEVSQSSSTNTTEEKNSTFDRPITRSLSIEQEKKQTSFPSLTYIQLPKITENEVVNHLDKSKPFFSNTFLEKHVVISSTPFVDEQSGKIVGDTISPIKSDSSNSSKLFEKSYDQIRKWDQTLPPLDTPVLPKPFGETTKHRGCRRKLSVSPSMRQDWKLVCQPKVYLSPANKSKLVEQDLLTKELKVILERRQLTETKISSQPKVLEERELTETCSVNDEDVRRSSRKNKGNKMVARTFQTRRNKATGTILVKRTTDICIPQKTRSSPLPEKEKRKQLALRKTPQGRMHTRSRRKKEEVDKDSLQIAKGELESRTKGNKNAKISKTDHKKDQKPLKSYHRTADTEEEIPNQKRLSTRFGNKNESQKSGKGREENILNLPQRRTKDKKNKKISKIGSSHRTADTEEEEISNSFQEGLRKRVDNKNEEMLNSTQKTMDKNSVPIGNREEEKILNSPQRRTKSQKISTIGHKKDEGSSSSSHRTAVTEGEEISNSFQEGLRKNEHMLNSTQKTMDKNSLQIEEKNLSSPQRRTKGNKSEKIIKISHKKEVSLNSSHLIADTEEEISNSFKKHIGNENEEILNLTQKTVDKNSFQIGKGEEEKNLNSPQKQAEKRAPRTRKKTSLKKRSVQIENRKEEVLSSFHRTADTEEDEVLHLSQEISDSADTNRDLQGEEDQILNSPRTRGKKHDKIPLIGDVDSKYTADSKFSGTEQNGSMEEKTSESKKGKCLHSPSRQTESRKTKLSFPHKRKSEADSTTPGESKRVFFRPSKLTKKSLAGVEFSISPVNLRKNYVTIRNKPKKSPECVNVTAEILSEKEVSYSSTSSSKISYSSDQEVILPRTVDLEAFDNFTKNYFSENASVISLSSEESPAKPLLCSTNPNFLISPRRPPQNPTDCPSTSRIVILSDVTLGEDNKPLTPEALQTYVFHDHSYTNSPLRNALSSQNMKCVAQSTPLKKENDLQLSDIVESSSIDDVMKHRKTPKPIRLKPGKSYRRSLSLFRKSSIIVDGGRSGKSCHPDCVCLKCVFRRRTEAYPLRRTSQIVPVFHKSPGNTILENYAWQSISYVQQEEKYNDDLDDSIRSLSLNERNSVVPNLQIVTAKEVVLRRCGQAEVLPFEQCYPESALQNCQKIGEGVYGEVFLYRNPNGGTSVMKIIPIEGDLIVNGEKQKRFEEILSEIVISMELSNLRNNKKNTTSCFSELKNVKCVHGRYPDRLIDLWELYDETRGSENDSPQMFPSQQQYIVLELGNGGVALESYVFNNAQQALSMFKQTACALAIAENQLKFEHRDLHWGNILINTVDKSKTLRFRIDGKEIDIETHGIEATIIDFTLSRIECDGVVIFNDLSLDNELFIAKGDYQFEIYRLMQKANGNSWQHFVPYTNILWLHYVLDKGVSSALRFKNPKSKVHRECLGKLKKFKDEILSFPSVVEFIKSIF